MDCTGIKIVRIRDLVLMLCLSASPLLALSQPGPQKEMTLSPDSVAKKSSVASEKKDLPDAYEFVAIVNGEPISQSFYDLNLQEWLAQGQKDTPELRKKLKEELINRELIAQEVSKKGLDANVNLRDQIKLLKHKMYVQIYSDQYFKDQGLTEEALRQEYQSQKKQSTQNLTVVQYKLNQMTVREKSTALALIGRLEQGESFELIANQIANANGVKGGRAAAIWVNSNQISSELSGVLANLSVGGFTKTPLAAEGGWLILKLEDKRSGKLMTYEEYRSQKIGALLGEYYNQTLRRLRSEAKIN